MPSLARRHLQHAPLLKIGIVPTTCTFPDRVAQRHAKEKPAKFAVERRKRPSTFERLYKFKASRMFPEFVAGVRMNRNLPPESKLALQRP